jgi:glycosyltransferase involved in cell wall biosynthesis
MISFIVPAYNEERMIGRTLEALQSAARSLDEAYEIVVVDDASEDGTVAVARSFGARVVRVSHRQIAASRNSGAREATGGILIFVDADTLAGEAVVQAAVKALREGAIGGGATVRFDGRLPFYARLILPSSIWVARTARLAAGCFLFCTRRAFEAAGGFDEKFFCAEELVLGRALKRQGRFVVLRESVTTSGRKLRAYPAWKLVRIMAAMAWRGRQSLMRRDGLDFWYRQRNYNGDGAPDRNRTCT